MQNNNVKNFFIILSTKIVLNLNYFCEAGGGVCTYFFFKFDKNLLIIAAPTPNTSAKTIENIPYKIGASFNKSLTNMARGVKDSVPLLCISLAE